MTRGEPYRYEHDASTARAIAAPKNLLHWFVSGFRAEVPDELHANGVWREWVTEDGRHAGGGSLLGSPRLADAFRRLIEDDAFGLEAAEYEGHKDRASHYRTPMRAALASLAGRGRDTDEFPFAARALYRTALRDGDWDAACASLGIIEPVRRIYINAALSRLWRRYSIEPRTEGVAA